MKKKILAALGVVTLTAGAVYAYDKATLTQAYYTDGVNCRTVTLSQFDFTDGSAGPQAFIQTDVPGVTKLLWSGKNGTACNNTPIQFQP